MPLETAPGTTPTKPPPTERPAFGVLLGALVLYWLRFGYDFGVSDQDEIVPILLHRLSPALFARDWFVMGQAAEPGIRTWFVSLLEAPALVLPVWLVVLVVYVMAWLGIAAAVHRLSRTWSDSRLAAAAAVVAVLVLTPQWTLGGNDLVHSLLVPSMVGWALGLWGLAFGLDERPFVAGVLLALAAWMQALVGLQLAAVLGLLYAWHAARGIGHWRLVLLFAAAFTVCAAPVLAPLIIQQLVPGPAASPSGPTPLYIRVLFRNPHHYLFRSFPTGSLVRFGAIALVGSLAGLLLEASGRLWRGAVGRRLLGIVVLFGVVAYLGTEVRMIPVIATLQLFKMTVLAKVILVSWCCGLAAMLLPAPLVTRMERLVEPSRWTAAIVILVLLACLGGAVTGIPLLREKIRPLARAGDPATKVADWALSATPENALFAVPPSWSGFRTSSRRAVVVTFKAVPHRDDLVTEWYHRLHDVAPMRPPERGYLALADSLDAAFVRLSDADLEHVARLYGVDFAVRREGHLPADSTLERVFAAPPWTVYRMSDSSEAFP